jgi:Na+/melibiose symporter-like transporter
MLSLGALPIHGGENTSMGLPMTTPKKPLGTLGLAAFAAPAGPLLALSLAPLIFLAPFYARTLDIPYETAFLAFFAARIFDIVIDPFLGARQDLTEARFGRRRIWLLGSMPVLWGFVWLGFFGLPHQAHFMVVLLMAFGLYASFASMMIAHLGWAGELGDTYHGRTRVLGAVQIASAIGQIVMLSLPALIAAMQWGDSADGVRAMGAVILVLLPATTLIAVFSTRERPTPPHVEMSIALAFETLRRNRSLRALLAPDFVIGAIQGITASLFIFYATSVLQLGDAATAILFIYFIAGLVGVPIWVQISRRRGKHKALQYAALFQAVAFLPVPFLPPNNFVLSSAVLAIAGLAGGAGVFLVRAMLADVVDEDRLASGRQRSGLFFGLLLTTTKVGLAIGPLFGAALSLFDYDDALGPNNTPTALAALSAFFVGLPITLNLLVAYLLRGYPLTEDRLNQIRAEIAAAPDATTLPASEALRDQSAQSAKTAGPSTR